MASETTTIRLHRHPLIYTSAEAAAYLGTDEAGLEVYRREFGLIGHRPAGKGYSYWRPDLDASAEKAYAARQVENRTEGRQLRLVGGRAR